MLTSLSTELWADKLGHNPSPCISQTCVAEASPEWLHGGPLPLLQDLLKAAISCLESDNQKS